MNNLGLALREVRRFEEAIAAHEQATAIHREVGDRHAEGRALNNVGIALQQVWRFEEAIASHQQAATIFEAFGDHYSRDIALANLAEDRRLRDE
ncbi:tetratricopeptide repeat protein [Nonomuraea endophytica]|uniref:Tetratricopeptide (TPR) repeat protein n=1 Tax=Nonomuraea endophytica TaxID=714136 RepID=A0A7W8AF93_9ACTN|nr:tetratricopeptide repeat protein [Nonomuraea endophytica]MBB5085246.1 tetratricopeptide (TPR) repeat protein [Nonomuraea endophytica]